MKKYLSVYILWFFFLPLACAIGHHGTIPTLRSNTLVKLASHRNLLKHIATKIPEHIQEEIFDLTMPPFLAYNETVEKCDVLNERFLVNKKGIHVKSDELAALFSEKAVVYSASLSDDQTCLGVCFNHGKIRFFDKHPRLDGYIQSKKKDIHGIAFEFGASSDNLMVDQQPFFNAIHWNYLSEEWDSRIRLSTNSWPKFIDQDRKIIALDSMNLVFVYSLNKDFGVYNQNDYIALSHHDQIVSFQNSQWINNNSELLVPTELSVYVWDCDLNGSMSGKQVLHNDQDLSMLGSAILSFFVINRQGNYLFLSWNGLRNSQLWLREKDNWVLVKKRAPISLFANFSQCGKYLFSFQHDGAASVFSLFEGLPREVYSVSSLQRNAASSLSNYNFYMSSDELLWCSARKVVFKQPLVQEQFSLEQLKRLYALVHGQFGDPAAYSNESIPDSLSHLVFNQQRQSEARGSLSFLKNCKIQ